jgi:arthrofactin-type cyclic lipopeptide synthetase C
MDSFTSFHQVPHVHAGSIAELAAELRPDAPGSQQTALTVRASGSQRPLFLVHEFHGEGTYFATLAAAIDADVPIIGLLGAPLDGPQPRTIESLAARLVAVIHSHQSTGPYSLAGWSFGGLLVYEIANQLLGHDQMVDFVGLIDTRCPAIDQPVSLSEPDRTRELLALCAEEGPVMLKAVQGTLKSTLRRRAVDQVARQTAGRDFLQVFEACAAAKLLPDYLSALGPQQSERYVARLLAHDQAQQTYQPQPLPLLLHLFVGDESAEAPDPKVDPTLNWRSVLPPDRMECVRLHGNLKSMMETHIAELGLALSRQLARARGATASPTLANHLGYAPEVTVQRGRVDVPPLYCVPGAGDNVFGFAALAGALGTAQPVLGLQPRGLDGVLLPHVSVEATARGYLRAIEKSCPRGPVHLLGHSFGGWVVFELALLLTNQGRPPATLTIVDGEAPESGGQLGAEYGAVDALLELVAVLEMAAVRPLGIDRDLLASSDAQGRLQLLHQAMVRVELMPPKSGAQVLQGPVRTFMAALRTRYLPSRTWDGVLRIALVDDVRLTADANRRAQEEAFTAWQRWAPKAQRWHGPGNHMTILKYPHVAALAAWWQAGTCPLQFKPQ